MASLIAAEQSIYDSVSRHVQGDEKLHAFAYGLRGPNVWWSVLLGGFASFLIRPYNFGATETGLIVVQLTALNAEKGARVIPWQDVRTARYRKGKLQDVLQFTTADGDKWKVRFQFLAAFRKNRENARLLGQYFETRTNV